MSISVQSVGGGRSVVTVAGDLDIAIATDLRERGDAELASSTCRDLVVDLSDVTFLDSTGLGALIGIRNSATAAGAALSLRNPGPRVVEVLDLAGLTGVFTIETLS